jgi:hypothetical protein
MVTEKINIYFQEEYIFMKTVKRILTAFLFTLFALIFHPAWAQDPVTSPAPSPSPPDRVVVLQIPYILSGDCAPLTPAAIHTSLEANMEKNYPRIDVQVLDKNDSRLAGIDITKVISMSDARKIAKIYKARFVSWGTLKFSLESKTVTTGGSSYEMGPMIQTSVTAMAVAKAQVYDAKKQDIVVDQPMIQTENERTRAMDGSRTYNELVEKLLNQCVTDLSSNLLQAIKREFEKSEGQQ